MNHNPSPVVDRRRLRLELRQARQHAGLTQEEVANHMEWSLSKVIRIETGAVGISRNDLAALLRLYQVEDPNRVSDLLALGKTARQTSSWNQFRDILPQGHLEYIEHETSASIIRSFEVLVVPDLLQTEEYATAIARLYGPHLATDKVSALVETRMIRQELLLNQSKRPVLYFILDEAVIQRLIANQDLRQVQLEKLISMASRPEVNIEVVPFAVGLHRGMVANFRILEFSSPIDNDLLFIEGIRGSLSSSEAPEDVAIYRELFEDLRRASLGPKESVSYLRVIVQDIARQEKIRTMVEH
jgi:transcriptional regulator with XRE-family HTH domain